MIVLWFQADIALLFFSHVSNSLSIGCALFKYPVFVGLFVRLSYVKLFIFIFFPFWMNFCVFFLHWWDECRCQAPPKSIFFSHFYIYINKKKDHFISKLDSILNTESLFIFYERNPPLPPPEKKEKHLHLFVSVSVSVCVCYYFFNNLAGTEKRNTKRTKSNTYSQPTYANIYTHRFSIYIFTSALHTYKYIYTIFTCIINFHSTIDNFVSFISSGVRLPSFDRLYRINKRKARAAATHKGQFKCEKVAKVCLAAFLHLYLFHCLHQSHKT